MESMFDAESQTFTCQDQEFFRTLRHEQNEQRKLGKYCDFTLETEDGGSFTVHKCIVEPASPYFKKILNPEFRDSNVESRMLPGVSSTILEKVIEFMYTWEITISNDSVKETLDIALFLRLDYIVDKCTEVLAKNVNYENCLDLLTYSEGYHRAEILKDKCANLILSNLHTFINANKFVEISADSMIMILSHDRKECNEEQLYSAVVKWIDYDMEKRQQFISPLIDRIQFERITYEFVLTNIMENNPLLKSGEFVLKLADIVRKSLKQKAQSNLQPQPKNIYGIFETDLLLFDYEKHSFAETVTKMNRCPLSTGFSVFNEQNLFVCGGLKNGQATTNCEYFSMEDKIWKSLRKMEIPRYLHQAITLDDKIYVCGGINEKSVEIYNTNKDVWLEGTSLDNDMWLFGLCALGKSIYAVNGKYFQRLDPRDEKSSWESLPPFQTGDAILSAVGYENSIFGVTLKGIATFDTRYNKWSDVFTPFKLKFNHEVVKACLLNNEICICGPVIDFEVNLRDSQLMHCYAISDLSHRYSSVISLSSKQCCFGLFTM